MKRAEKRWKGVPPTELVPDPAAMKAADERQRREWVRCGRALAALEEEVRDLTKELAGKRKQYKRLVRELAAAASEERLPLFEAQFEGGK